MFKLPLVFNTLYLADKTSAIMFFVLVLPTLPVIAIIGIFNLSRIGLDNSTKKFSTSSIIKRFRSLYAFFISSDIDMSLDKIHVLDPFFKAY